MQPEETVILPTHLGLILDGNRRWAKAKGLPPMEGHRVGYQTLKKIALEAFDKGIPFVSAFTFSTENWNRSKEEVDYLMKLVYWVAEHEIKVLDKKNIRVMFAGMNEGLSKKMIEVIKSAEERTKKNTHGTLVLCFNYGGHQEIVDAAKRLLRERFDPAKLTTKDFAKYLYTPEVPPIDLAVRTSGEYRLSGFMLWRMEYAELAFVEKNWPDFSIQDLNAMLRYYAARHRRFGK